MSTTPKIAILDTARGVCAFIVALYHFLHFENQHGALIPADNKILMAVDPLMHGSICVFFIISGYVMYLHMERNNYDLSDYLIFILKRVGRIMIPAVACILSMIAINWMFHLYLGEPINLSGRQLFANLTLTANFLGEEWYNPIFWTLSVEFQFYFFLGFGYLIFRKYPFVSMLLMAAASVAANYFWDMRGTFVEFSSYFVIGIALHLFRSNTFSKEKLVVILLVGCTDFFLNEPLYYYTIPLLSIPIILFVSTKSKLLEFAGETSYSFYLMHGILGGWFLYFTVRYADGMLYKFLLLIGAFVIAYLGSYLFYRLIEKPSHNLAKRIRYNRTH